VKNNKRFLVEKSSGLIIDLLNPASSRKANYADRSLQSELRECVLMVRLGEIVDKLVINVRPLKKDFYGQEYQPFNEESHSIWLAGRFRSADPGSASQSVRF
jgi:hypothetical protein